MNRALPVDALRKAICFGLLALVFGAGSASSQVVSVTDTTGWNPWTTGTGALMTDPITDQQTGQGADDMVGDATTAGFLQKAGTLGGTTGPLSYVFRVRMNTFDSRGFSGNLIMGGDLNGDGQIDFFMKLSDTSKGPTLSFAIPTSNAAGANTSPSTTAIGSWVSQTNLSATGTATYNYQQVTTDAVQFSATPDAYVTFAAAFSTMQTGIRALTGSYYDAATLPSTTLPYSGVVIDSNTRISFIAATSTQGNALNQDLYGVSGSTNSTLTWSQLGSATSFSYPSGVVPEPATYLQIGVLLLAGGGLVWRQRRARSASS